MFTIYQLKTAFQNQLRPIVNFLANKGISANQVTIAAMVLSFFGGAIIYTWPHSVLGLCLLPVILLVRMAMNAIDGMLAREHNMKSPEGALLNEVGDVLSDVALYAPFAWVLPHSAYWIILILFLSILGEFVGVLAVQIGASRRYDGPFGKSDRAFAFGLLAILLALPIGMANYTNWVGALFTILAIYTILNRIKMVLKEVK